MAIPLGKNDEFRHIKMLIGNIYLKDVAFTQTLQWVYPDLRILMKNDATSHDIPTIFVPCCIDGHMVDMSLFWARSEAKRSHDRPWIFNGEGLGICRCHGWGNLGWWVLTCHDYLPV